MFSAVTTEIALATVLACVKPDRFGKAVDLGNLKSLPTETGTCQEVNEVRVLGRSMWVVTIDA